MQVFLDANVAIYASGPPHRLKEPCRKTLELVQASPVSFVTSAEVMQEVLHYYLRRRVWPQAMRAFDAFQELMAGRIEPITAADVALAARLAAQDPRVQSRDYVHTATMRRLGTGVIVSADAGFDLLAGVRRLDPTEVPAIRSTIEA